MSSLQAEYQRFLGYLADQQVPDDVRRMANLVMTHLPHLAEVGATRRARSVRLAPLAVQHLPGVDTQSPDIAHAAGTKHDGECYEFHLCEGCFFGTIAYFRQERRVQNLFDESGQKDATDTFWLGH